MQQLHEYTRAQLNISQEFEKSILIFFKTPKINSISKTNNMFKKTTLTKVF